MHERFKKIYIEITNVCNLACNFCPGTARKPVFMGPEAFERVLDKIAGWTMHLCLHVMGEPLLHPELGKILDICEAHAFRVNLTTNGTLLEEAGSSILEKAALRQVSISLHSMEANSGKYNLDSYLAAVVAFARKALDRGRPIISLRLWNSSGNAKNSSNAYIINKIGEAFKPGLRPDMIPSGERGIRLAGNLYLNTAPLFRWPGPDEEDLGSEGFCRGLRDQIAILADGTVVPCCLDGEGRMRLGIIFEQDFGDIVNGERALSIYRGFTGRKAVEELCRKCGYRSRFSAANGL